MLKDRIKQAAQHQQGGFAITFEVMMTMVLLAMFFNVTLYCLYTMNVVNTITQITTNSVEQMSRWGGYHTKAFQENVAINAYGAHGGGTMDLHNMLNQELAKVDPPADSSLGGFPVLKVNAHVEDIGPAKISHDNEMVWCTVKYNLPMSDDIAEFAFNGEVMERTMTFSMPSLMGAGKLL